MGDHARAAFRHGNGPVRFNLDLEPAIEAVTRRGSRHERRSISKRWLSATIITGLAGSALIGAAIYAALDRQTTFAQAPEYAMPIRKDAGNAAGLRRGDRLVKKADIVAEKESFRAPTTVNVGNKQVIRLQGYTHVATTLTLASTELADEVPAFNPLKLLSGDQPSLPDTPPDPGPVLDVAEVSFVVRDLTPADPASFAGELSMQEVSAQVEEQAKSLASAGVKLSALLPPQLLLMQTSRAGLNTSVGLAYGETGMPARDVFSSIEVKMVPENVTVMPKADGREATQAQERLVVMRHGDGFDEVLRANGATRDQVRAIVDAFGSRRGEPPVGEGRRVKLLLANVDPGKPSSTQIARVSVYLDETLENTIALDDAGRYVRVTVDEAGKKPSPSRNADEDADEPGGMRLYDSIYQTALKQQIPKPIIDNMIRIFSNDVDFQQSVQGGDSIDAFYTSGDEADGRQDLLFASLTVRNDVFHYYRFQPTDDAAPDYYDDNGRSVRKFLIRTPVPTGIFTSGFGMRFHPVLGYSRPHTGVDWAAPVGTPILASGNGTVLKAERSPSYGNHIEIQHANGYITTYSHMVGFARGMADGIRVRQGQVIGYLGQTGLATGPHLHYEVIVNGHFVDPMRVKLARTQEIQGRQMGDFKREHDRIDSLIASAPNGGQAPLAGSDPQKRAAN